MYGLINVLNTLPLNHFLHHNQLGARDIAADENARGENETSQVQPVS